MHTTGIGDRAFEYPLWQGRSAQRLAGVNVFFDPVRDLQPAGFLPQLEWPLLCAEPPAHREVDVAGGLGDAGQMHGGIVEAVTQNRPHELPLRTIAPAQQTEALTRRLFQHAVIHRVGFVATSHVTAHRQVKTENFATYFFKETSLGFLSKIFLIQ